MEILLEAKGEVFFFVMKYPSHFTFSVPYSKDSEAYHNVVIITIAELLFHLGKTKTSVGTTETK